MLRSVKQIQRPGLVFLILIIFVLVSHGTGICAGPKKVAVVPFVMNSDQDLTFLQNGLFSMISSRMSDPGKVTVLDRETVEKILARAQESELAKGGLNEDKARIIGANLGADFILFGSLTHFGESVSLDASMVDVTGEQNTLSFFDQTDSMGDVIPLVNTFANDINQHILKRRISNDHYAAPAPRMPEVQAGFEKPEPAKAQDKGMVRVEQEEGMPAGFATHLKTEDIITAMAAGDLKNDGSLKVVTSTDSKLYIHRFQGSRLVLEEILEYSSTNRIVSLDIADINNNGYPEIFVTSLTIHRDGLQSFVVEYNGTGFVTMVEKQSIYYRVVDNFDGTKVLYGQDKGGGPFSGRVHIMMPAGDIYSREKRIRLPRDTSVLALVKGAVTAQGLDEYAMLNGHNRLVIANDTGKDIWKSEKKYGGTNHNWLLPRTDGDTSYREMAYLNPRILFHGTGEKGGRNLVLVKNSEAGGGAFGQYKNFKEGQILIMAWNGIAMAPILNTVPVQGWISDFAITDIDGDGVKELVVSVITRTKMSIFSKDKASSIISYKLE